MLLAKKFLPSDRAVKMRLKPMIKGGGLPPFIAKNDTKPVINKLANGSASLPLLVMMLASRQARFGGGKWVQLI